MVTVIFKNLLITGLLSFLLVAKQATAVPITDQEMIPPAPPGPYISTGLRDIAEKISPVATSSSDNNVISTAVNKPTERVDMSDVPMEMFSPDRPWPVDIRSTNSQPSASWMPVGGNQQVPNTYMPNYGSQGYGYQIPNGFVPQYNYPNGYPMNKMPYPSNYQQGYPN